MFFKPTPRCFNAALIKKWNHFAASSNPTKPKLYYHEASPPVRFVLMTIDSLNIDLNYKRINLFTSEQRGAEFKKINHLHRVPTLTDDDLTITDSHAISTYLVDKYSENSPLYPKDIRKRAKIDNVLYFNCDLFFPRESVLLQSLFNPANSSYKHMERKYVEMLHYFEKYFDNSKWLAGDEMTLADLCCIATYSTAELVVAVEKGKFPKTEKWASQCKEMDVYENSNYPGLQELKRLILRYGDLNFITRNKDEILSILNSDD